MVTIRFYISFLLVSLLIITLWIQNGFAYLKTNKNAKQPSGDNLTWPDCLKLILNVICFVSCFQNGIKHQNRMKTDKVVIFDNLRLTCSNFVKKWDQTNNTEKNRGIFTIGFHRKTVGCGCFLAAPKFYHNFNES